MRTKPVVEINGSMFSTLEEFAPAFSSATLVNYTWHGNLDAFNESCVVGSVRRKAASFGAGSTPMFRGIVSATPKRSGSWSVGCWSATLRIGPVWLPNLTLPSPTKANSVRLAR